MSTIASPRPSFTLSSRRTSTDTDTTRSGSATRAPAAGTTRRNRAALRDYYNLKAAAPADGRDTSQSDTVHDDEQESELDQISFDPEAYVQSLLSREGLEGVLGVEAGLVSEVRSLDGEKKALVYDNYSKLIAATDTIRSMREKMDPMTPTTRTLSDDIGHIAHTAATLSKDLKRPQKETSEADGVKQRQQQTVKWILDAPRRLEEQVSAGNKEKANLEWDEIQAILEKWKAVKGVDEVRQSCLKALKSNDTG